MHLPEQFTMTNRPKRKKLSPTDLILYALAVFMLFRIPWNNINSFHFLILFMFLLCMMLRFSNLRRAKIREFALKRKQEEEAARAQQNTLPTDNVQETPAEMTASAETTEMTEASSETATEKTTL